MNLSAVVLTKNEEKRIKTCIESLDFCDEVVVIDDYSEDKTVDIAEKLNAKVDKRKLNNNFSKQKNYGLSKTKGKWVLFIDADEVVDERLKDEIIQIVGSPFIENDGFYIKRKDIFLGKKMNFGEAGKMKLLRLARRDSGKWKRAVHETWEIKGKKGLLKYSLIHKSHLNLNSLIKSINYFSTLHAKANLKEGKRSNIIKIIIWPWGKFFYNLVFKLAFLDGIKGIVFTFFMSFHSFLSWSKLWLMQRKSQ